jgi:hypothetical protein
MIWKEELSLANYERAIKTNKKEKQIELFGFLEKN